MKSLIISLVCITVPLLCAPAATVITVSTLDNTYSRNFGIDPQIRRGIAFTTGTAQSYFDSINLLMNRSSTSPNSSNVIGELYLADSNNLPIGTALAISFSHSAISITLSEVTFTPNTPFVLEAMTSYVFALTASSGSFVWGATSSDTSFTVSPETPNWAIIASVPTKIGGVWTSSSENYRFLSQIQVSVVPEPSSTNLLLLSFFVLFTLPLALRRAQQDAAANP